MKIAKYKSKSLKPYLHFSILSSILLWNSSAFSATNDNISAILQRELELQLKGLSALDVYKYNNG